MNTDTEIVSDLLKPRVKCIAPWPYMPKHIKVGELIPDNFILKAKKYPHLFSELAWWQYREEKDMPLYVKDKTAIPNVIRKIQYHFSMYYPHSFNHSESKILDDVGSFIADNRNYQYWPFIPATEQEYLNKSK